MGAYKLTRDAEADIAQIYLDGLAMFGEAQAEKYALEMDKRFSFLATKKIRGSDYGHIRPELRRADYVSHAVYYQHTDYGILILRILHGSMDPARHL